MILTFYGQLGKVGLMLLAMSLRFLPSLGIVVINYITFSDESTYASANFTPVTKATRRTHTHTHKMHKPDKINSCLCMKCDYQHWQRF